MTKRNPVSAKKNLWFDGQEVDNLNLTLEQQYNDAINSSIINNHFGSGVVPDVLVQNVLFDSSLVPGILDGVALYTQTQPSDQNYGNQLEVELTDSQVAGKRTVKVAIIGLDFEGNLQYERFTFKINEKQLSKKHYANILLILTNDLLGNQGQSFNLEGRLLIKEAKSISLSRDTLMTAQNYEPNLFFRDFYTADNSSLTLFLQNSLPLYNTSNLNITTGYREDKVLAKNDVVSQVGEKFLATTTNIQKVRLLLSVGNTDVGMETELDWHGDIIVSLYPLQSSVDCPTDIVPDLPISFDPNNLPIAQVSFNYNSLKDSGVILDGVPQPVDFVFSNTPAGSGNNVSVGNYYIVTVKRSGSADKCDILIASGNNWSEGTRVSIFTGTHWLDLPDEDLWFEVYTDAAKVSDGQAYESGFGISIPKTAEVLNTTVDYCLDKISFATSNTYTASISAAVRKETPIADPRTGNPVFSEQEFIPSITLLSATDLINLEEANEPLLIGSIVDKNKKFFDSSNTTISAKLHTYSFSKNEIVIKVVDDASDPRYDADILALTSYLIDGSLVNSKLIPNPAKPEIYYRIAKAELCTMVYGDINGDGLIDEADKIELNKLLGANLNVSPALNTVLVDNITTVSVINGYLNQTSPFIDDFGVPFKVVDGLGTIIAAGNDGSLVVFPDDPSAAQFTSASVNFTTISGIDGYKLVVNSLNQENKGIFTIEELDFATDVLKIRKVYLTSNSLMKIFRADFDNDYEITTADGYILQNYINKVNFAYNFTPPCDNPYLKIGTKFNVIKLKVEQFIDRSDDYPSTSANRDGYVHTEQDVALSDDVLLTHNFELNPQSFNIIKQFTWEDYLVLVNSNIRNVPVSFTSLMADLKQSCARGSLNCVLYPDSPEFTEGKVDFYVPDNLIIDKGEITRPDGNLYKVDFEVGTIVLEIPDGFYGTEKTLNIFEDFIADYSGNGLTRLGYPAMKFSDCSYVANDALDKDQVRFSVAVQSFSPNTNGLDSESNPGVIVDGKIGVSVDYSTGLLTLNFTNLYQDPTLPTLNTKVQVHTYLKKSGFNNETLFVNSEKVANLLRLVSIFPGANIGDSGQTIDLASDVIGILPVPNGGTGLDYLGFNGQLLMSNGTALCYKFIWEVPGVIDYSNGPSDAERVPKTDFNGLLDPSFYYKNPVYIYAFAGTTSSDLSYSITAGSLSFRFDSFIRENLKDIRLEVIGFALDGSTTLVVEMMNLNDFSLLTLDGVNTVLTTTSDVPVVLRSDDLTSQLLTGAADTVYDVNIKSATGITGDYAVIRSARLVITYDNPVKNSNFSPS